MIPFAKTQACFSLSFLFQTFVRAPSSEICVQRGSRSSIKASTVATAAALSRRSDLGDGPSVASRAIDCLGFCTSLARSFVSGVARAVAARSSNAARRVRIFALRIACALRLRARCVLACARVLGCYPVWSSWFRGAATACSDVQLQLLAAVMSGPRLAEKLMNGATLTRRRRFVDKLCELS